MYHIVFKRYETDFITSGVTLPGELISCINKQQDDFKNSIIVGVVKSNGLFIEELYKKEIERWNQKV